MNDAFFFNCDLFKFLLINLFCISRHSAVGDQYEVGTWAPEDLLADNSTHQRNPSNWPSDSPSRRPSYSPSMSHAPSVSAAPITVTWSPSTQPSAPPSAMPSLQCHDIAVYRSPLNSLNCSQHLGTDCFQWKHLGLTADEIVELIVNCPTSCNINCGSLMVFSTNLTYQLQYVDNFLSPETTLLFEDASADYITKNVLKKKESSKFSLNRVELLSQRILEKEKLASRQIRFLQDSDRHIVDLNITVAFHGFALEEDQTSIDSYIIAAVKTYGYIRALRFTNDPSLKDVVVALQIGQNETSATEITARNDDNSSPWRIITTVFVLTGIIIILLFYIKKRIAASASMSVPPVEHADYPIISPSSSTKSMAQPNFSYDSVVRFTSIRQTPRSDVSESAIDSTEDESTLRTSPNASVTSASNIAEDVLVNAIEKTFSGEKDHPLTGLIPAMIVYECIDEEDEQSLTVSSPEKGKSSIPIRHVAATQSFRKALQENSLEALDDSMFHGILDSHNILPKQLDNKKIPEKASLSKQISLGESTAASDASTVRTGVCDRESSDFVFTPQKDHGNTHAKGESSDERQSDASRRGQAHKKFIEKGGRQIMINAPCVGKLGLVIRSSSSLGHVVIRVKDYSPLKNKILCGDRIVQIDGRDTNSMTLEMVTNLFCGERRQVGDQGGAFQILVMRPNQETLLETIPVNSEKTNSRLPTIPCHGRSTSVSSMRSTVSAPPIGSQQSYLVEQSKMSVTSVPYPQGVTSNISIRSATSTSTILHHGRLTRSVYTSSPASHRSTSSQPPQNITSNTKHRINALVNHSSNHTVQNT